MKAAWMTTLSPTFKAETVLAWPFTLTFVAESRMKTLVRLLRVKLVAVRVLTRPLKVRLAAGEAEAGMV